MYGVNTVFCEQIRNIELTSGTKCISTARESNVIPLLRLTVRSQIERTSHFNTIFLRSRARVTAEKRP